MAAFTGVEVWSDVECNSGIRRAWFGLDALIAAREVFSLTGEERAEVAVYRDDERAVWLMIRGNVVRFCTTDATVFREWRIGDDHVGGTGDEAIFQVTALPISADLSRGVYSTADESGTVFSYALTGVTASDVIGSSGPVRAALDSVPLSWIVASTVDPTNTFDIAGEWETARQIIDKIPDPARATGEFRLVRNGTTNYGMQIRTAIGSTLPTLHLSTGRNLQRVRRSRYFAESATRVIPRAQEDGTSRTIERAFWVIASVTANTFITVTDPRGGSYPGPARAADQFNGMYVAVLTPAFVSQQITDTLFVSATETRFDIADTTGFTVGGYVDLRTASGADAARVSVLTHEFASSFAGAFPHIKEFEALTGAVSYALNPFIASMTTTDFDAQGGGASNIDASTASDQVTNASGTTAFLTRVFAGDILLRDSDSAVIGTVESVDDNDTITLTANAAIDMVAEAWNVRKATPTGWTVSATDDTELPRLNREATAETISGSGAFRVRAGFNNTNQFNTPVFPVDKDKLWQFWIWYDARVINAGCTVTFTLRREDTGAQIGDAIAFDSTDSATVNTVIFTAYDVSASATGVRIRMVVSNSDSTFDAWLGPVGCQPAAWARRDVYGPLTEQLCANDVWHAGNAYLADVLQPAQYECEIVDREQIDAGTFPNDAIDIGQPVVLNDAELGLVGIELRVLDITRDHLARTAHLRFGSPVVTFGEFTEKRRRRLEGFEFDKRVTQAVARRLIEASSGVADRSITEVAANAATDVAEDALLQIGTALTNTVAA